MSAQGLVALSRLGVYIRLPGVNVAKFEQSMQGGGLLGYIDTLSGGSLSKVGVFSLGKLQALCACTHMCSVGSTTGINTGDYHEY